MSSHLILIVEEDQGTRAFLAEQLVADGYEILLAENRRHALHVLAEHQPQLVLADINGQTLGLLDAVRGADGLAGAVDPNTPMIVLIARADELDRVRVFDRGGDDVVSKPFSYPELRGRIRVLLRRAHEPRSAPVSRVAALRTGQPGRRADRQPSHARGTCRPAADRAGTEGVRAAANVDRRTHPRVDKSQL